MKTTFFSIVKPSGVFAFDGEIIKSTEKAVCVKTSNGEIWFPKSALKNDDCGYEIAHWFKYNQKQMNVIEPISRFYSGDM